MPQSREQRRRSGVQAMSRSPHITALPSDSFVTTREIDLICERALAYLEIGQPVHLAGHAGTGKTTLALHLAALLGRPVMLIHGDDAYSSADLVGRDSGYRKSTLVDNYVHTVLKTEEEARVYWAENRLTTACRQGYTLIYDEFTRSRPEANNALLAVLSEGLLPLPPVAGNDQGYLRVHPEFRAIFTSNPAEYTATHKTQDALRDRLVTLQLTQLERDTQVAIVSRRAGISLESSERIVDLVIDLYRELAPEQPVSLRGAITIGKLMSHRQEAVDGDSQWLRWACCDVLGASLEGDLSPQELSHRVDAVVDRQLGTRSEEG
ncbi:MAG: gas vesicle protein GvpN [Acidobacteriota bacterium]